MWGALWAAIGLLGLAPASAAADAGPGLDQLIEQFNAGAPEQDGVDIEGWVENGPDGPAVVVVVAPRGEVKLVADPGITVIPTERAGVEWRGPLPLRKVDAGLDYFPPPATVRLPFTASDERPVELLVEYAYCVVDFQCFFGEERLTLARAAPRAAQ